MWKKPSPKMSTKRAKKPLQKMSIKRSKKPSTSTAKSLTDLPSNVLVEILARLPLRTLFVAKSVCKTFGLLTTPNPHFINLHSSNATQILVFQFGKFEFPHIPSHLLRFADKELHYKKSELKPLFRLPKVGADPAFFWQASCFFLVNSCNGLLFFLQHGVADFCSSVVCNPVTNEYILIPEVNPRGTRSMWLGYTPATDQYKMLRIFGRMYTLMGTSDEVSAQVSVIGSDTWRHIDATPLQRAHLRRDSPMALVNGVMYWHHPSWSDLFSFDFETEKFKGVALPPEFQRGCYTSIGVLGGCLCLTCNYSDAHRIDLWVMTKCGSWIKQFVVDTCDPVYGDFRPLQFLQNGQILMLIMLYVGYRLVCYDPRDETLRYFWLNKRLKTDYRVLALTPSFVPLKDTLKVDKVLSGLRPRGDEKEDL